MEAAIGLKPLKIGNLVAKHPVIQGGMGVGVSLSSLAGAVAKAGGIGIISTAQIGFKDQDFGKNPMAANLRAIHSELKKAREKAPQGILGFNIMVATKEYASYVKEAVKAGADVIISGAGLPIDMPKFVAEAESEADGGEKKERRHDDRADRFFCEIGTCHLPDVGQKVPYGTGFHRGGRSLRGRSPWIFQGTARGAWSRYGSCGGDI